MRTGWSRHDFRWRNVQNFSQVARRVRSLVEMELEVGTALLHEHLQAASSCCNAGDHMDGGERVHVVAVPLTAEARKREDQTANLESCGRKPVDFQFIQCRRLA